MIVAPHVLLDYWFSDKMEAHWFASTEALDQELKAQFEATWQAAQAGGLNDWLTQPDSALALIIVLDQLPLNMFRGHAQSFATEQQAVAASYHVMEKGWDQHFTAEQCMFTYLPLMHSEHLNDQDACVQACETAYQNQRLSQESLNFARGHRSIVQRFGRFPHRNAILDRISTPDEMAYLASDEAFKG